MDDSMDPAIIQIWNDYSKLMSDNNTLKDAVLGLLRAIMYLESHPGFPGDVVSTLWGIVKLLNYSDQGDQDIDTDKDALVEAVGDSSVQWTSFVNEATTGQVGVKSGKQAINDNLQLMQTCSNTESQPLTDDSDDYIIPPNGNLEIDKMIDKTAPRELLIKPSTLCNTRSGVFTGEFLECGITFGPLIGERLSDMSEVKDKRFSWKVFTGSDVQYIDGSDADDSNWMSLVQHTDSPDDHNLEVIQDCGHIFYKTSKAVVKGSELLLKPGRHRVLDTVESPSSETTKSVTKMITRSSTRKIGRSKCRDIDCDVQDNVNLDETTGEILDKSPVEDNESVCDTVVETMNEGGTVAAIPPTSEEKYSSSEEVEPQPNSDNVKDEVDENVCHVCIQWYASATALKSHMRTHSSISRYTCKLCQKYCKNANNFKYHMLIHSGVKPFACQKCEKEFRTGNQLKLHDRTHTGEQPYRCSVCGKHFSILANQKQHMLLHTGEHRYNCPICDKTFIDHSNFKRHKDVCQRKERGEENNSESPHNMIQCDNKLDRFLCDTCGQEFKRVVSLRRHVMSHTGERPYKCTICPKEFKVFFGLQNHLRVHAGVRPYKCQHCPKDFTIRANLNVHMLTHTDEKRYKCTVCHAHFRHNSTLHDHLRRHNGIKQHKCVDCDKCFATPGSLKLHNLTHTGEKPHSCGTCGKLFSRRHHLKLHINRHHMHK